MRYIGDKESILINSDIGKNYGYFIRYDRSDIIHLFYTFIKNNLCVI